jgi:hypothetical protein
MGAEFQQIYAWMAAARQNQKNQKNQQLDSAAAELKKEKKMKNGYWDPVDKSKPFEKNELVKMLTDSGTHLDIATEVADQLSLVEKENSNIIFIFTDDNQFVVTGIHVPAEALDGKSGPVLMRGGNDKSIIAAFSRDFVAERLETVDSMEKKTGLHGSSDVLWVEELENLAEMVRIEMKTNPPESWDELLTGE